MVRERVRGPREAALLHRRASFEGLDAVRDTVTVRVAVGLAKNKAGDESVHHPGFQSHASQWQSPPRTSGMECALSAQCHFSLHAGSRETNSGSGPLRFQLALCYGYRMFSCGNRFRIVSWPGPGAVDENLLAHPGANAAGYDRDFFHVGPRLCDPLFGTGRGARPRLHPHRMAVSVLRNISG